MSIIDGAANDWFAEWRLDTASTGALGYGLFGTSDTNAYYFAITSAAPLLDSAEAANEVIGAGTTLWLDTDLDRTTGYQIWGFTGGVEYNVQISGDGEAQLFSGGPGETLVATLPSARSADGTFLEFSIPKTVLAGLPESVRIFADVNDAVFLPNDYNNVDLIVTDPGTDPAPAATVGTVTLEGALGEWGAGTRLDTSATGTEGYAIHGDVQDATFLLAIASDVASIGTGTTIWLDTDMDRATGYQIWGFAGGAEYNVNIGADGVARLYSGGPGETFVADLDHGLSPDGSGFEVAVPQSLLGSNPQQVRVFADVNDAAFLPNDYANIDMIVAEQTQITVGAITLDGSLADWAPDTRLDTPATGAEGYAIHGDVQAESYVFAIAADAASVGNGTTIWLDADMNRATGYQIWGFAGGVEYNINVGADGIARLYSGGAGETFVAELDQARSADGATLEVAVPKTLLAGAPDQVRVLADVNDTVFLPNDYTNVDMVVGGQPPDPATDNPALRVGIVYSDTTAANYYSVTAYGQLFMSAQNQARQAGVPFDLLTEADLLDPANLAGYDALIFPGFSHVQADQVDTIAASLETAAAQYGIGLIAAGNFLTNDESGAALPGNSYERMQSLLGVTIDGYGQTQGLTLTAENGGNPILDGYVPGEEVGAYSNVSYLNFADTTGTGEVLFSQIVSTPDTAPQAVSAVIATQTAGNNVHFATDAILGNNNILGAAVDWALSDTAPDVSLLMTRGTSLFYSRNDMDQSQESWDVIYQSPGIYDVMLPILEEWYEVYGFVGSHYINIGANPPDQITDWSVSTPHYQALMALESEIGSHSYTHTDDTNLLSPDTPEILALAAMVDPRNPDAVAPWTLSDADLATLLNSFRFQFETSRLVIEQQLGITVGGAAVPGMPETLDTTREIIDYYDYISGGYSAAGAGYPGAFGYLTPADTAQVYLAPNMSFDFSLIQFRGLTPDQAIAEWQSEYSQITSHATTPIIGFPWHDYGLTDWYVGDPDYLYPLRMFENMVATAEADGTEFVTGQDLADRINAFSASELTVERVGDVVTATVASTDAGHFALDMGAEGTIASVNGWYAWNNNTVFLPKEGGTFEITLGAAEDVTHITALPDRADLWHVAGDGSALDVVFEGRGEMAVALRDQGSDIVHVTGAGGGTVAGADRLTLQMVDFDLHSVSIDYAAAGTAVVGGEDTDLMFGGSADDVLTAGGGDDTLRGGAGTDTFVFGTFDGHDTVLDFTTGEDVLSLVGLGYASAADALAGFAATADGLELQISAFESVLLAGLDLNGLAVTDIEVSDVIA